MARWIELKIGLSDSELHDFVVDLEAAVSDWYQHGGDYTVLSVVLRQVKEQAAAEGGGNDAQGS